MRSAPNANGLRNKSVTLPFHRSVRLPGYRFAPLLPGMRRAAFYGLPSGKTRNTESCLVTPRPNGIQVHSDLSDEQHSYAPVATSRIGRNYTHIGALGQEAKGHRPKTWTYLRLVSRRLGRLSFVSTKPPRSIIMHVSRVDSMHGYGHEAVG
jgi:hypothetical protein